MKRTRTRPAKTITEGIVNVLHFPGEKLVVQVGLLESVNGKEVLADNQNLRNFEIRNDLYTSFIETNAEDFSSTNLWPYLDAIEAGAPVTAPSGDYIWDAATQQWIMDLPTAKLRKKKELQEALQNQLNGTITYDGKLLQIDSTARNNILGKMQELNIAESSGEVVNSPLIWRDANNTEHTWTSETAYKTWLEGLAKTISEFSTTAYVNYWQKLSELEAATTLTDIKAITL